MERSKIRGTELSPKDENRIVRALSQSVITDSIMSKIQTQTLKTVNYKMSASLAKVEFHFRGVLTTNLGNQDLSIHQLVNCWNTFIS